MAVTALTAMLVGAAMSAGTSIYGQQQAKKQARQQREAQEKELSEQRVLDAAQQAALQREEDDVAEIEIGDLTVGTRAAQKKEVRAAPSTTGLRVG